MKKFAWAFFIIYTICLMVSTLPTMGYGFLIGVFCLTYVGFAQFWVIFTNRVKFKGFFKSSIFHLIPIFGLTYFIGSQMFYFMVNGEGGIQTKSLLLSLLTLAIPFLILWLQYFFLTRAFEQDGGVFVNQEGSDL